MYACFITSRPQEKILRGTKIVPHAKKSPKHQKKTKKIIKVVPWFSVSAKKCSTVD